MVGYWTTPAEFVALTRGEVVRELRTDVEEVIRDLCLGGAALSDGDRAKYFQDVERVPVC